MRHILICFICILVSIAAGAASSSLPSADKQPVGFTGYIKDSESGLYYANARYYDPSTGRFTTEDPEAGSDVKPPSLHRYLYAYANPTVYTDRTGRRPPEGMEFELRRYRETQQSDAGRRRVDDLLEYQKAEDARGGAYATATLGAFALLPVALEVGATYGAVAATATPSLEGWLTALWLNGLRVTTTSALVAETAYGVNTGAIAPSSIPIPHLPATPAMSADERIAVSLQQSMASNQAMVMTEDGMVPMMANAPPTGPPLTGAAKEGTELSPAMAPSAPIQRPADSPYYSVAFRAQLQQGKDYPGLSAPTHFQESNRQLNEAMRVNPDYAASLEQLYPGLTAGVQPGARGAYPRSPPTKDLTWHHNAYEEGVMELMPVKQHTASGPVQKNLHPEQKGGMEIWGGGRDKKGTKADDE